MNQAANEVILQVALTFDHDAISSDVEKGHRPFDRSIGEFGPRVGLPRILQILARECVDNNNAVVMVSHDLNLSYGIATHALLMMPDGSYISGEKEQVMSVDNLSLCLAHPIERFVHGEQVLFLPRTL